MSEIPPIIDVVDVHVLGRYVVELCFADGEVRILDLEPLLAGPMYEPLAADYELFCQVRVDPASGTIVWPNDADISPRTLHAESKAKSPV